VRTPRRFSVQAFWGLSSWLLPLVIVFLLTPRLLHQLGTARFGVLMIVLITPIIATQLDFGLGSSAVRRFAAGLSQGPLDGSRLLFSYSGVFCAIALLFGTAVALGAEWLAATLGFSELLGRDTAVELIRWCAVWVAVSLATGLPALVARAAQSYAWLTAVQTASTVVLWVGALLLVGAGYPLRNIVILGIAISVASTAVMAFVAHRAVRWDSPLSFQLSLPMNDARFASGMFATQIASAIAFQADRILISSYGSPAIAGAYSLCVTLANKPLAAVAAITSFAYPHASGLHATGAREQLSALLHALDRAVVVLVVPILLPALWLAEPFFELWLGAYGTPDLVLAFKILLVAFAMTTFAVPASHVLAASGRSGPAAAFSWLTAIIVLVGIVALVPPYGLLGAVVAIFAAMSTTFAFSIVARRTLALGRPPRWRFWAGVLVGVSVQAGVLWMLATEVVGWVSLILVGTAGWGAFFLVRATLKLLSPEEVRVFNLLRQTASSSYGPR